MAKNKMTATKKISLRFPRHLVSRPVVYHLIKDFNLELNILKANITSEEGHMVLELKGERADFDKGIEYLTQSGLIIDTLCREVTVMRRGVPTAAPALLSALQAHLPLTL